MLQSPHPRSQGSESSARPEMGSLDYEAGLVWVLSSPSPVPQSFPNLFNLTYMQTMLITYDETRSLLRPLQLRTAEIFHAYERKSSQWDGIRTSL